MQCGRGGCDCKRCQLCPGPGRLLSPSTHPPPPSHTHTHAPCLLCRKPSAVELFANYGSLLYAPLQRDSSSPETWPGHKAVDTARFRGRSLQALEVRRRPGPGHWAEATGQRPLGRGQAARQPPTHPPPTHPAPPATQR
jgi:hypothetical protein